MVPADCDKVANPACGPLGAPGSTLPLQARVDNELAEIAAQQHALARRRAILRGLATRLRLGEREAVVLAELESAQ